MATCPVCGERVPLGGGRTVKNAALMYVLAQDVESLPRPGEDERSFIQLGVALADSLHRYGHRQSTINPDWQSAGLWTRQAKALIADRRLGTRGSATRARPPDEQGSGRGDLRAQFPEPSQLAEREADQAYEWVVQDTHPDALPKSSTDVAKLVNDITPKAMDRMRDQLRQAVSGPTAFPNAMFDAMEQAFRNRLSVLFTGYVKSTQGILGGWVDALREGQSTEGPRNEHPDAWAFGEATAQEFSEMLPDSIAEVRAAGRDECLKFIDGSLDPMGPANMRWAISPFADRPETYEAFSLGFGSRMLALLST